MTTNNTYENDTSTLDDILDIFSLLGYSRQDLEQYTE